MSVEGNRTVVLLGDCLERMAELDAESIDAVVTDPPYGIGFMGKDWDSPGGTGDFPMRRNHATNTVNTGVTRQGGRQRSCEDFTKRQARDARTYQEWCQAWASECLRLLKPGAYLVAMGGTRMYHRLACGIEDAGFEVRDSILDIEVPALAWLYGEGFPKGTDKAKIPEGWEGWNTALKPAFEPIIVARKSPIGTLAANLLEHGTGALNIDGCRIPVEDRAAYERNASGDRGHEGTRSIDSTGATDIRAGGGSAAEARWPANVVLDEPAAAMLDEQSGLLVSGANPTRRGSDKFRDIFGDFKGQEECVPYRGVDVGGASRFFYCPKAKRGERNAGLEAFEPKPMRWSSGEQSPGTFQSDGTDKSSPNHHPTVKPIELMRWLCRLVAPPDGLILDPFAGSGSTGCAAALEDLRFLGIEFGEDYVEIAKARIAYWSSRPKQLDLMESVA